MREQLQSSLLTLLQLSVVALEVQSPLQIHRMIHDQFMKGSASQNEENSHTLSAKNTFLSTANHHICPRSQGCVFSPSDPS